LKRIEGRPDMILFVENGYGQAISYHAAFSDSLLGASVATSICPVPPGKVGVEHWPHSFRYLRISDLTMVRDGDPVDPSCIAPVQVEPVPGLA